MFAFSEFCKAFLFCLCAGVHGVGWGGAFSSKESNYCAKGCQDRGVDQISFKGGAGHLWRETGVFLGKESRMFSQINEFQNQVSCSHQCLWGGQDCVSSPLLQWVPRVPVWKITIQGELDIALVWQAFHSLSITVFFSMLNSHWQKLLLSDHWHKVVLSSSCRLNS